MIFMEKSAVSVRTRGGEAASGHWIIYKKKAWKGRSSSGKADRELPAGERRLWNLSEYIPELRTERTVGCDGTATVILPE